MVSQPVAPVRGSQLGLIEILGYIGITLAVVGTIAVVIVQTDEPSQGTITFTAGVLAAALLLVGILLGADAPDRLARLRSVCWFLSAEAFGVFIAVAVQPTDRSGIFLTQVLVAVYGFGLWLFVPRLLQQLVFFNAALGAILALVFPDPSSLVFGPPNLVGPALVLWLGGAGWFALGAVGRVRPPRAAMILGTISSLVAPFLLFESPDLGAILVVATSAVYLFLGGAIGDRAVSGIAIVGLIVGTIGFLSEVGIEDVGSAWATLTVGVIVLLGALLTEVRIGVRGSAFGKVALPIGPRVERVATTPAVPPPPPEPPSAEPPP